MTKINSKNLAADIRSKLDGSGASRDDLHLKPEEWRHVLDLLDKDLASILSPSLQSLELLHSRSRVDDLERQLAGDD